MNNKKVSVSVVFWIEDGLAKSEEFIGNLINPALDKCESLRNEAKAGSNISHVCMSTDMVGNVTLLGVSDILPSDYNWTKRRTTFNPGREIVTPLAVMA